MYSFFPLLGSDPRSLQQFSPGHGSPAASARNSSAAPSAVRRPHPRPSCMM